MLSLSGHLGDLVAALVDGQLDDHQEERAWQHVLSCPGCREAVEEQVATKQVLGALRDDVVVPASSSWLRPEAAGAWEQVADLEQVSRRRSVLVGGLVGGGLTATLAVAVVIGGAGVTAPASRSAPSRVVAGVQGSGVQGSAVTPAVAPPAAPGPTAATWTGAWTGTWTGTAVGGQTSHAFRSDRTR